MDLRSGRVNPAHGAAKGLECGPWAVIRVIRATAVSSKEEGIHANLAREFARQDLEALLRSSLEWRVSLSPFARLAQASPGATFEVRSSTAGRWSFDP